ncbi:hypothetical protein SPJ2_0744 [Streptococcus parauberis KRS-02109]|uniref:Uncharacterized protein n=1 Tax=Streptococcus parauberis KRS-02083 TaxID=1207545 RepID=A0ABN0ISG2_9STRE|nr:hypothetical protein SPJ2_0744 [Streptococcus parauberis KRS-02109]EMG25830.1 hypothetical protein SPJ1_1241 [Streptococcus parauberis KRS-02083]
MLLDQESLQQSSLVWLEHLVKHLLYKWLLVIQLLCLLHLQHQRRH